MGCRPCRYRPATVSREFLGFPRNPTTVWPSMSTRRPAEHESAIANLDLVVVTGCLGWSPVAGRHPGPPCCKRTRSLERRPRLAIARRERQFRHLPLPIRVGKLLPADRDDPRGVTRGASAQRNELPPVRDRPVPRPRPAQAMRNLRSLEFVASREIVGGQGKSGQGGDQQATCRGAVLSPRASYRRSRLPLPNLARDEKTPPVTRSRWADCPPAPGMALAKPVEAGWARAPDRKSL